MCSVYLTMAWRNASLDSGDIISPFQVFSFTVQTMSFGPWQVSKRRPKGQLDLCIFGVLISTKSPTFKFWGIKFHFLCVDNSGRYSCFHQTQNIFAAAWIAYHFFLKPISLLWKFHGLYFIKDPPVNKWFVISGSKSLMSLLIAIKGWLFSTASTLLMKVCRQSSVKIFDNIFQSFLY